MEGSLGRDVGSIYCHRSGLNVHHILDTSNLEKWLSSRLGGFCSYLKWMEHYLKYRTHDQRFWLKASQHIKSCTVNTQSTYKFKFYQQLVSVQLQLPIFRSLSNTSMRIWSTYSPGRSVLKIHIFIESGPKMIQFKTKSRIFIKKKYSFNRVQTIR